MTLYYVIEYKILEPINWQRKKKSIKFQGQENDNLSVLLRGHNNTKDPSK